jgi:hypothetical protein
MYMKKLTLLLAAAGLLVAGTKSYDVTFTHTAVLGSVEVPAGKYQLKFDGAKVTLVNPANGKHVDADATMQEMPDKFARTIVVSKLVEGKDMVDEIQLAGTKTALDFKH